MKIVAVNEKLNRLQDFVIKTMGNNKVSSTSKIMKITAIKKNCNENGMRAEFLGSNPHSNGLFFSRSENVFIDLKFRMIKIIIKINQIIFLEYKIINIIYTKLLDFLIGSQI